MPSSTGNTVVCALWRGEQQINSADFTGDLAAAKILQPHAIGLRVREVQLKGVDGRFPHVDAGYDGGAGKCSTARAAAGTTE